MKTVQELEKELQLAKAAQKLDQENIEMGKLIESHVGKCYGTSSFTQKRKHSYNTAISIDSIERYDEHKFATAEGTIVLSYRTISFSNGPDWMKKPFFQSNYSRGCYTSQLNHSQYNMWNQLHNLIERKKEISVELFETLYCVGDEIDSIITDNFYRKLPLTIEKTMGDSGNQESLLQAYTKCGIEILDLEKYPDLMRCLQYCNLPGFFEDRFLIKDHAKAALEYQAAKLDAEANSRWTSSNIRSHKLREISIIQDYIRKL